MILLCIGCPEPAQPPTTPVEPVPAVAGDKDLSTPVTNPAPAPVVVATSGNPSGDSTASPSGSPSDAPSGNSTGSRPELLTDLSSQSPAVDDTATEDLSIDPEFDLTATPEDVDPNKPLMTPQEQSEIEKQIKEIQDFDPAEWAEPELTEEQKQQMVVLQKEADSSRTDKDTFLKIASESADHMDPDIDPEPQSDSDAEPDPNDWRAALRTKPVDLGQPLVDDPEQLTQLHPSQRIWLDKTNKQVVILGAIAQQRGPLELFLCTGRVSKDIYNNIMPNGVKAHESVLVADIYPHLMHAALLAVGVEPGKPAVFVPSFVAPSGAGIDVIVRWKDADGKTQQTSGGEWITDDRTHETMKEPFVFTGSMFMVNGSTGKRFYMADADGMLICVSNFSQSVMDLPIESSSTDVERIYIANEKAIPPRGTPVTIILKSSGKSY